MSKIVVISEEALNQINQKLDLLLEDRTKVSESEVKWLNNKEACRVLKVSTSTLQTYRNKGIIPFSQVRRKILYDFSDIQAFLDRNKFCLIHK
jgi:excisionase family DNA binding protein